MASRIFGTKYPSGGESDVYIDENKLGVINSSGYEVQDLLWSREGLSDSKHNLRIVTRLCPPTCQTCGGVCLSIDFFRCVCFAYSASRCQNSRIPLESSRVALPITQLPIVQSLAQQTTDTRMGTTMMRSVCAMRPASSRAWSVGHSSSLSHHWGHSHGTACSRRHNNRSTVLSATATYHISDTKIIQYRVDSHYWEASHSPAANLSIPHQPQTSSLPSLSRIFNTNFPSLPSHPTSLPASPPPSRSSSRSAPIVKLWSIIFIRWTRRLLLGACSYLDGHISAFRSVLPWRRIGHCRVMFM